MKISFEALLLTLCVAVTAACADRNESEKATEKTGEIWRFTLDLNSDVLPFTALIEEGTVKGQSLHIYNADETISVSLERVSGDTLFYRMPVFNSELILHRESPELITGLWRDHDRENYSIPVVAESGKEFRFTPTKSTTEVASRYKVRFGGAEGYDAVLLLDNENGRLTGTFLTETGDYRYLEGNIMNGKVNLSTFDGSHAWLFDAVISGDSLKNGRFLSGDHYTNSWNASADDDFELTDPTALVNITSPERRFRFSLPDLYGDTLTEKDFINGKTVHVYDITGSWCPNCKDAALTLDEISSTYPKDAVRVIPIAFERSADLTAAREAVSRMQSDLGINGYYLFGGKASRQNTSTAFPDLEQVLAYPTIVVTDKDGRAVKVFTGFYGPGTGIYHDRLKTDIISALDSLTGR